MIPHVLVVMMATYTGGSSMTTAAYFRNLEACDKAGKEFIQLAPDDLMGRKYDYDYVCLPVTNTKE